MPPPDAPDGAPPHSRALPASLPDAELLCAACAYDLRNLPASGPCPECGLPILSSIPILARMTIADWTLVRRGIGIIFVSNLLGIAWMAVGIRRFAPLWTLRSAWFISGWFLAFAAIALLRAGGYRRLALAAPPGPPRPHWAHPRESLLFRAKLRARLACIFALLVVFSMVLDIESVQVIPGLILMGLGPLYLLVSAAHVFAARDVLSAIAARTSSKRLAKLPNTCITWAGVLFALGIALFGIGALISMVIYHLLLFAFFREAGRRIPKPLARISQ